MPLYAEVIPEGLPYNVQDSPGTFKLTTISKVDGEDLDCVGYLLTYPVVTAGYGGWSRVARPRKKALTEWVGRDSATIRFDFLIDDLAMGNGLFVRTQIRSLEKMAGLDIDDPEPPRIRIDSRPPALFQHSFHHASQVEWFIDTLEWDASSAIVNKEGNPIRLGGTLEVTQYVEDQRLSALSSAARRRAATGTTGKRRTYTVKSGDTLSKIAARKDVYGDASKWKRIADANHIRDPKNLKVGQTLKIP
jgi:LysM repeat protein